MYNNGCFFNKKHIKIFFKNKNFRLYEKMYYKYKKVSLSIPEKIGIKTYIKSIIRPYNYIFFLKFFDFKKKEFRPKRIIKLQYYFFFFLRDKKNDFFYKYMKI